MPKKFQGENSKAAVAKARKAAIEHEKQAAKEKAIDDAYWEDDDKQIKKKQQRKENKEKKREDQTSRKQEARRLLLDEEEETVNASTKSVKPSKLTRAQIQTDQERVAAVEAIERKKQEPTTHLDTPLEENPNLTLAEQEAAGFAVGRNVEEAISALSVNELALDKHPEKRVKAAYKAFEDVHLPRLKAENPNLRLSQLKQMLKKDWTRSHDNPLNQSTAEYNAK